MTFGWTEVINIDPVEGAVRKPNISHDLSYRHSYEHSMLNPECESQIAHIRAISWHDILCKEYGLVNVYGRNGRFDRDEAVTLSSDDLCPRSVAAAIYEPGVRRWLVDTGCPFDLIAERDLETHEESYIKRASKFIRLATPNGIVDADKIISFKVPQLGEPIDAYLMKSTPTVMSIGRRCMQHGYSFVWKANKKPYYHS